uniref:Tubulin--tyrosine ligase-like protein 9 n=1 Tax=Neogobius melanostomus TaxID=47308 RepID=A0A8C6SFX1_9GOBI
MNNTIQDVLRQRPGWVEVKEYSFIHLIFPLTTSDGEWDFNWCDVGWLRENFDHSYMEEHVRLNHFRNHYELTRKNLMVKNLKRYRKNIDREEGRVEASKCDFFPCTFTLPSEYHLFVEEFKRSPGSTWIMKPVAKSQGKGIFLFKKLKDIMDWKKKDSTQVESYVAQRYIENPYLINGNLTLYPLKAWLYRDGFARFSNTRFSLNMHLTNVAVQKTAPDYDPEKGCKWQVQQLRTYLTAKHGREKIETLFKEIYNIFVRSLQSVQKVIINDKHCFELYGYDILLDENLKPWLIEVNASPSLTASSKEDYEMKCRLLEDTLNKRVGGYDLMWNDGPVYREDLNLETYGSTFFTSNAHLGKTFFHQNFLILVLCVWFNHFPFL